MATKTSSNLQILQKVPQLIPSLWHSSQNPRQCHDWRSRRFFDISVSSPARPPTAPPPPPCLPVSSSHLAAAAHTWPAAASRSQHILRSCNPGILRRENPSRLEACRITPGRESGRAREDESAALARLASSAGGFWGYRCLKILFWTHKLCKIWHEWLLHIV